MLVGEDDLPKNTCPHPASAASFASVVSAGAVEISRYRQQPTLVNGIPVYLQGGLTYYVPMLDVWVHASGPLARRVLHTLTWSPAAVALGTQTQGVFVDGEQDRDTIGVHFEVGINKADWLQRGTPLGEIPPQPSKHTIAPAGGTYRRVPFIIRWPVG